METNRAVCRIARLRYPILSDPTKETARAYGVLAPSGYASRWTFYIGADGRILDIDKKVSARMVVTSEAASELTGVELRFGFRLEPSLTS